MNTGIYEIKNIVNGKLYVGSTAKTGFLKRWDKHKQDLNLKKHHSIVLQRAWNKYGNQNFNFKIIENCIPEICLEREQYYIDTLKPEYNICKVAGNTLGIKLSKEYCEKLKIIRKGKNNPFYGKTHTAENRQLFSLSNKKRNSWIGKNNPKFGNGKLISGDKNPFYGKTHTKETKNILSQKMKGRFTSNKHPNFIGEYEFYHEIYGTFIGGQCDICKKFNLLPCKISMMCSKQRKNHRGWVMVKKLLTKNEEDVNIDNV